MRLKLIPALCIACCFTFFGALTATAQFSSMAARAPWLQSFFAKMSPDTPDFSAIGQCDLCTRAGDVQLELPMDVAVSTNVFRWEVDASKVSPLPPQVKTMAKMMRTDRQIFLVNKNEQRIYMIYPDLHAYIQIPIPESALADVEARSDATQVQKTELGRETIDGHPCIRNKAVTVEPGSPPEQGLMWNATDLQGFPIKMQLNTARGLMKFQFQDVVIQNPDPTLFLVPGNYNLFTNSADLMDYAKNQALAHAYR